MNFWIEVILNITNKMSSTSTSTTTTTKISLTIIFFIELSILTIVSTTALIIILNKMKKSKRRRQKNNNNNLNYFADLLLALLFFTHALSGITNIVWLLLQHVFAMESLPMMIMDMLIHLVSGMVICNTIIISVDRFLAIQKPFLYQQKLQNRQCGVLTILTIVLLPTCFAMLRWVSNSIAYTFGYTFVLLGLVIVTVTNFFLYRLVKQQCHNIASLIVTTSPSSNHDERHQNKAKQQKEALKKRQMKSLKVCSFIALTYLLTWVPLVTFLLAKESVPVLKQFNRNFIHVNEIVAYMNGFLDVFIYFYLNKQARRTLSSCCCFFTKSVIARGNSVHSIKNTTTTTIKTPTPTTTKTTPITTTITTPPLTTTTTTPTTTTPTTTANTNQDEPVKK